VTLVGFVDFNAPQARCKANCLALCNGICEINDQNPAMNCSIIIFPDLAKDSSLRGLYDEEKQIQENLFANKQFCDARWVELYDRDKKSDTKSNGRKFGCGRIVTNFDSRDENPWLQSSELAVAGRPLAENSIIRLPKGHELLIPEGSSPDADIRLGERVRPSSEQSAAQKGAKRVEILIQSLFKNMEIPGPVVLVNLTGYVEEAGTGVLNLMIDQTSLEHVTYISRAFCTLCLQIDCWVVTLLRSSTCVRLACTKLDSLTSRNCSTCPFTRWIRKVQLCTVGTVFFGTSWTHG
jgi:hypothetical protein